AATQRQNAPPRKRFIGCLPPEIILLGALANGPVPTPRRRAESPLHRECRIALLKCISVSREVWSRHANANAPTGAASTSSLAMNREGAATPQPLQHLSDPLLVSRRFRPD